ncbi:MAG TPA: hypothetical protein PLM53_06445 [Spirochaetota bacterium]|nr:hypothetical protein [Spirochaetota bacterium]HQF07461.1 hypothetical protein [Spirochaetota bacterium]HQH96721.1 hypothetical protein [Spirochaetota bacterium]
MNAPQIPDITLERYVLNELPAERMKEIGKLVAADPSLRKRVDEISESSRAILKRYAPESMAPLILRRAVLAGRTAGRTAEKRSPWRLFLIPSLAAAAVVTLVIFVPLFRSGYDSILDPSITDVTRVKGAPAKIFIYRKTGGSAELLANNRRVREKDLLQIAYYSAEDTHGIVLSLDGRGTVTLHYPTPPSTVTAIEKNRQILLPNSYELDDAPGFERFILITSRKPLDVRSVLRAAQRLAKKPVSAKKDDLTIDTPCRQTSLVLLKD